MSFVYSILNLFTSARSEDIKNNAKQLLWKVSLWRNVVLFVGQKQTKKKKKFPNSMTYYSAASVDIH